LLVTPVAYSIFAELEGRKLFSSANTVLSRLKLSATRFFTFMMH
jgi:hypothetical protein